MYTIKKLCLVLVLILSASACTNNWLSNKTNSTIDNSFDNDLAATPEISNINDQMINEDDTVNIPFTITDTDTSLACDASFVTVSSSNMALLNASSISLSGTAPNCLLSLTPLADQNGAATINVEVSDGSLNDNDSFILTVASVNDAPVISAIANVTMNMDATEAIAFTISDVDDALDCTSSVSLLANSNLTLIDNTDLSFSGTSPNCILTASPNSLEVGTSTISLQVTDGTLDNAASFDLNVYFDPPLRVSLNLWLDAADANTLYQQSDCTVAVSSSGHPVACWQDKSGNSNHAIQAGASSEVPSYITSGTTALNLDGSNDHYDVDLDFLAGAGVEHHVFIVANTSNYLNLYGAANGGAGSSSLHVGFRTSSSYRINHWGNDLYPTISSNFNAGSFNILNYNWIPGTGNFKEIFANGFSEGSGTNSLTSIGPMSGGGRIACVTGHGCWGGQLSEMIFYTGPITVKERQLVEGYLACKWGLQVSLDASHPFVSTCPFN